MTFDDISQWLIDYVAAYPKKYNQIAIWREPIVACAPADDRFLRLKEITVPDHALPSGPFTRCQDSGGMVHSF